MENSLEISDVCEGWELVTETLHVDGRCVRRHWLLPAGEQAWGLLVLQALPQGDGKE